MESSSKSQQLYDERKSVNLDVLRQDPLCLPAELVMHIFSHLRCDELSLCLRVSKKWACTLTSGPNALLWRNLQFSDMHRKRGPGLEELKRMLSWAGDGGARKVVIPEDMIDQSMLTLLLDASPCLEYLKIGYQSDKTLLFPTNGKTWNRLRHFSIHTGYYGFIHGGFPCSFLQDAASSLEHLDFNGITTEWCASEPSIPFLPKLKTFRIHGSRSGMFSFRIYPLSVAFPRLEQLYIGPHIPFLNPEPVSVWRDKRKDIWPHLKVLIFELIGAQEPDSDTARTRSALRCLTCINRGNSLQHLCLDLYWAWPERDIFSGSDDLFPDVDIVQDSEFKNLRSFKSRELSISLEGARNLLFNAIQTEQLSSFDIIFPVYFDDDPVEERHVEHLRGYDWACGATSIHTLGFYEFRLQHPPDNLNDQKKHFVVQFLSTLPNLQTFSIDVHWDDIADYAILLVEILRHTHLTTLYMGFDDDEACAQVRQAARDQGVQLMKLPEPFNSQTPTPREWPVSLGE